MEKRGTISRHPVNDLRIEYSPFGVILMPIILLSGGLISPIVLAVISIDAINRGKNGAIFFLIFAIFMFLMCLPIFYVSIKCFSNHLMNRPAILLSKDYYLDNIESVKINWDDIINIRETKNLGTSYLKISVKDNSIIYKQAVNPILKFLFWNNSLSGGILIINLSLLKGKDKSIIDLIQGYQENATKIIRPI